MKFHFNIVKLDVPLASPNLTSVIVDLYHVAFNIAEAVITCPYKFSIVAYRECYYYMVYLMSFNNYFQVNYSKYG